MSELITAVLIDDEQLALDTLRWQLGEFCPEVEVKATFRNPREAVSYLNRYSPDICFLDVDMPEMNGFEMLKKLEKRPEEVVFVTAYSEYAIRAFKVSAFDYLLKPIDEEELLATINNYLEQRKGRLEDRLEILMSQMTEVPKEPEKIALSTSEGLHIVKQSGIIHLEAERNYTTVHQEGRGPLIISKTLKDVEKLLNPQHFVRIHQSHTINLSKVEIYHKGRGGSVTMSNGDTLPVSKDKKESFLSILGRSIRF